MAVVAGDEKPPEIVALPFPMQGHITPLLRLCHRLAARGIRITFVNTFRNHERLVGSKSTVSKVCFGGTITFLGISDGLPLDSFDGGPDDSLNAALLAADNIEKPFEDLIEQITGKSHRFACIISDGYLGWTQDVASRFGIPRVALWTSNVAYNLVNYHLPLLIEKGYAARKETDSSLGDDHLVTCIPGLSPLHPKDLPSVLQFDSNFDPGFKKRIQRVRKMREASWVLVNSFEELEHEALNAMQKELGKPNYVTVGPFLGSVGDIGSRDESLWTEDARCLEWLDKQAPGSVLYISFGSIATISAVQLKNLAAGVEASRRPFLWAMRPNLVSRECDDFFKEFVERSKEQGLVVEWAPQLQVLQHGAVGGHLSHCGWNSVLESIFCGIPILGWPCIAEQSMNCKRVVVDWKIGLRFSKDQHESDGGLVSEGEVERVIRRLFEADVGDELRRSVRELRNTARNAVKQGGSSEQNLDRFALALKAGAL